ncbi:unnamed protein product [Paramecium sonneborni]|uniref:Uncharacterized protein n=1 Tax=Paramecium sonneborni TaxID=65129 RepID=A0A8S1RQ61_9CILI|nr:unnamed protein product [Paramecium sonneborni]
MSQFDLLLNQYQNINVKLAVLRLVITITAVKFVDTYTKLTQINASTFEHVILQLKTQRKNLVQSNKEDQVYHQNQIEANTLLKEKKISGLLFKIFQIMNLLMQEKRHQEINNTKPLLLSLLQLMM